MQATYLIKRWAHHTPSGGYDQIARAMGGDRVGRAGRGGFFNRALRYLWRKTTSPKPYLLDYNDEDWLAEWHVLTKSIRKTPDIVHALYGDEQLDVLLRYRRLLNCPLVATFHLPTTRDSVRIRFEKVQRHLVKGIDAAIVVSRSQLVDFQRWLGADRVVYIPHGIDTKRFCPGVISAAPDLIRLVVVGDHMRDFDVVHSVADECRFLKLPVQFDVVVPRSAYKFFTGCRNVRLHSGVSEDQLIDLYRQADALFMPVLDATANNAILEALACGTPAISTEVGGIPDYLDESAGWLFPIGETDLTVNLIRRGCEDRDVFRSKSQPAREKALEYDWRRLREQTLAVYEALQEGKSPNSAPKSLSSV